MKKKIFCFVLLCSVSLWAQTVISIDESISRNQNKSIALSLGASLLLPGTGEYYLGEKQLLRPFIWTDAALWITTIGSYFIGEKYISSAHNYAVTHAGVSSTKKSVDFLNTVADYRSRGGVFGQNSNPDMNEDYNQAMIRSGKSVDEEYPNTMEYQWDWGSSDYPENTEHMDIYKNMLRNYRVSRIVFQVSVGALILNRVVSFLDVMRIYRATSSKKMTRRWDIAPQFYPDGSGAVFNYQF
jgi:hypothetical protein